MGPRYFTRTAGLIGTDLNENPSRSVKPSPTSRYLILYDLGVVWVGPKTLKITVFVHLPRFTLLKWKMASDHCPAFSGGVKAIRAKVKLINTYGHLNTTNLTLHQATPTSHSFIHSFIGVF